MCDDSEGTTYTCLVTPLTPASTSNRLPSGGNLGFGPSGQNPSCLGTVSGPSAQPLRGLRPLGASPPWGLRPLETFLSLRQIQILPL